MSNEPILSSITTPGGTLTAFRTGAGPDLLIVHSLLADWTAFKPVLPRLASRFRVTLVNLPGFHGTPAIEPGIERYAERLLEAFDGFELARDTILLANGFGGTVAVALAIRSGARFGKLIITDAAAGFPPEGRKAFEVMAQKVQSEGLAAVATIAAHRVFHPAYLAAHPHAVEERKQVLLGIAPEAFVAACHTLMETDLSPNLSAIENPTLVLCGELDAATPPALCRLLGEKIPGALYVELPQCGHCPPLEQPQAFLEAVEPFLS